MQIVFFGTPYYVIPILERLHKAFKKLGETPIAGVVTQPPKPAGRKQLLEYSEVDAWAHKKGVPKFFDPNDLIKNKIKADVGILASYGALVPKNILNLFPFGILVVHPSLLPQFRWASPVPAAIATNTNPTGVSILKMDEKWDHGPVITQLKEEILPNDTYGNLRDRLFELSADVLVEMLPHYLQGKIKLKPQDDSKASFARIIKKEDAFIPPDYLEACLKGESLGEDWELNFIKINGLPFKEKPTAENIYNFIRSMDPWPIAWTNLRIKNKNMRMRILEAHVEDERLILDKVQLEGKGPVSWKQFKEGYKEASFDAS